MDKFIDIALGALFFSITSAITLFFALCSIWLLEAIWYTL